MSDERLTQALAAALGVGSALSAVRGMHTQTLTQTRPRADEGSDERDDGDSEAVLHASLQAGDVPDKPKKEQRRKDIDRADKDGKDKRRSLGVNAYANAAPEPQGEEAEKEDREEKAAQRLRQELQKAKVAAYLVVLAETKKREEADRRRAQERARKRALLLSARIMSEAAERRAMGAEDKPRHRALAVEKDKDREKDAAATRAPRPAKEAPKEASKKISSHTKPAEDDDNAKGDRAEPRGVTGVKNEDKTFRLPPKAGISAEAAEALFQRLKAKQAKTAEGVEAMAVRTPLLARFPSASIVLTLSPLSPLFSLPFLFSPRPLTPAPSPYPLSTHAHAHSHARRHRPCPPATSPTGSARTPCPRTGRCSP